jgi:hypothetical protein
VRLLSVLGKTTDFTQPNRSSKREFRRFAVNSLTQWSIHRKTTGAYLKLAAVEEAIPFASRSGECVKHGPGLQIDVSIGRTEQPGFVVE